MYCNQVNRADKCQSIIRRVGALDGEASSAGSSSDTKNVICSKACHGKKHVYTASKDSRISKPSLEVFRFVMVEEICIQSNGQCRSILFQDCIWYARVMQTFCADDEK